MSEVQDQSFILSKHNLEELLEGQFGKTITVLNYSCKSATKAGDNYGSTLLSLHIDVIIDNNSETHHVLAKLIPPSKFLQEVFNVSVTFCKEINFYKTVQPELIKLQEECGVTTNDILNLVPTLYGARTSYDEGRSKSNDFDAVLLLGNLKEEGYKLADRLNGLDLKHCQLALCQLAAFHALVVALREKKPKLFKEVMSKTTLPFHIGPPVLDENEERKKFIETLGRNVPNCLPFLDDLKKCIISHKDIENKSLALEPFATLVHNDFWTNNMLFKYHTNSNIPFCMKIVDFQLTLFCSPVRDIIFFLYSSAQSYVIENHFDNLIDLYYESFISQIEKLKCNANMFSKSALLKELDIFAPTQLYHILFMTSIIYALKEETEDLKDISSKEHLNEVGCNEICRSKVQEIVNDFHKKGWIREYINDSK